jgi:sugar/nucleoside kinase (ribokinase family)
MVDVVAVGCVSVDELLYVHAVPGPDGQARITGRERQYGGLAATAAVAAARLGASCRFAGVLSADPAWRDVDEDFRREGVDVSWAPRRPDAGPILATVIVSEDGGRIILFDDGAEVGASEDLDLRVLDDARVLLVEGYGIPGAVRAARGARERSLPVVADLEHLGDPALAELVALTDHLVLPWDFAAGWTGATTPQDAVDALWSSDRDTVVVTSGASGCHARSREDATPWHVPAYPAHVVDTTGCGDVFHGAYAAALSRGATAGERVRFASAAAALSAAGRGGRGALPGRAEVEALIEASGATPLVNP